MSKGYSRKHFHTQSEPIPLPIIHLTPEEFRFLDGLRASIAKQLEVKGPEFQKTMGDIVVWELRRYNVEPSAYPSVGLAERVMNNRGVEVIAGFTRKEGIPIIVLSLQHPVVRKDPAQLLMSIFHETHHFLDWKKDPLAYEKEKDLPGDHPIEQHHEAKALEDLHAFVKESSAKADSYHNSKS